MQELKPMLILSETYLAPSEVYRRDKVSICETIKRKVLQYTIMKINNPQKILLAVMIIGLVILGGYLYVLSCRDSLSSSELSCSTAQKVLPFVDAVPFVIFIALVAGAIVFYLLAPKNQSSGFNKATLKFLTGDEKIIVQRLIEKDGESLQSDLTLLEGMTKVRSHRAIKKLQKKDVIEILSKGKTNIIKLNGDIYNRR